MATGDVCSCPWWTYGLSAGLSMGVGTVIGRVFLQLQYEQVLLEDALLGGDNQLALDVSLIKHTLIAVGLRKSSQIEKLRQLVQNTWRQSTNIPQRAAVPGVAVDRHRGAGTPVKQGSSTSLLGHKVSAMRRARTYNLAERKGSHSGPQGLSKSNVRKSEPPNGKAARARSVSASYQKRLVGGKAGTVNGEATRHFGKSGGNKRGSTSKSATPDGAMRKQKKRTGDKQDFKGAKHEKLNEQLPGVRGKVGRGRHKSSFGGNDGPSAIGSICPPQATNKITPAARSSERLLQRSATSQGRHSPLQSPNAANSLLVKSYTQDLQRVDLQEGAQTRRGGSRPQRQQQRREERPMLNAGIVQCDNVARSSKDPKELSYTSSHSVQRGNSHNSRMLLYTTSRQFLPQSSENKDLQRQQVTTMLENSLSLGRSPRTELVGWDTIQVQKSAKSVESRTWQSRVERSSALNDRKSVTHDLKTMVSGLLERGRDLIFQRSVSVEKITPDMLGQEHPIEWQEGSVDSATDEPVDPMATNVGDQILQDMQESSVRSGAKPQVLADGPRHAAPPQSQPANHTSQSNLPKRLHKQNATSHAPSYQLLYFDDSLRDIEAGEGQLPHFSETSNCQQSPCRDSSLLKLDDGIRGDPSVQSSSAAQYSCASSPTQVALVATQQQQALPISDKNGSWKAMQGSRQRANASIGQDNMENADSSIRSSHCQTQFDDFVATQLRLDPSPRSSLAKEDVTDDRSYGNGKVVNASLLACVIDDDIIL